MKIALIILHANPTRGGAERYTADLAAALAARGHEVSLLACDFGPPIPGVGFVPLADRALTRRARYARFLRSLQDHLQAVPYDIRHAMLPVPQCDFYHPHAGMAAESMTKWSSRLSPRRRMFARVEQSLLSSANPPVLLCLSNYVKQSIRNHYDLPGDRLLTLFNAVDLVRFNPATGGPASRDAERRWLNLDPNTIAALIIAQDFQRKGVRQAIEALAQANDPRLLLLVVGKDKIAPYQRFAENLKISPQVRFIGPVSDPWRYYLAADFFVLPTRHDPCSLVVLEALAMGLPVITTRFNGASQIMEPAKHGFILNDPADVPALADAIRQMLNLHTRQIMHGACIKLRAQLSFDAHVDHLLSLYSK